MKEADRLFSLLVRQDAADSQGMVVCATCGRRMPWRSADNGHFMVRQNLCTRFDRQNVAPQCGKCNCFEEGRQYDFAKYINEKYGEGTADWLSQKSKMTCKLTALDIYYLIDEFKTELKTKKFRLT